MRWTGWITLAWGTAVLGGSLGLVSCAAPGPQEMTREQRITRGSTLVYTTGCVDCHTPGGLYGGPDTTRQLSGSELGWSGPWGVSYAANLTPHETTGIGSWSEDEIVTAIRAGHRPDGSPILPPMPWPNYSRLSDEDAYALAAYLKSIPAIDHLVPENVPPGAKPKGPVVAIPQPPAWDTPVTPVPGGAGH